MWKRQTIKATQISFACFLNPSHIFLATIRTQKNRIGHHDNQTVLHRDHAKPLQRMTHKAAIRQTGAGRWIYKREREREK